VATLSAQRTAIETALTGASLKNTSDPTTFTAQQSMVVIFGSGSDVLGNINGLVPWGFRLACCVPLGPKTGTTALTTLTLAVLAVARALSGCRLVSVGPESIGTTEGGVRYLAADVNVEMAVTI